MKIEMEAESQASIKSRRKQHSWYVISQLMFAGLFAASLLIPARIFGSAAGPGAQLIVVVMPILAITLWGLWLGTQILKLEEFERSLAINSFALASAILLWAGTCYELLTPILSLPNFPLFLLAPVAVIIWQTLWEILRYRYL